MRFRSKWFLGVALPLAVLVVFLLPALVAFRYTAPSQRGDFVRRPWRGWSFAYAALAVPGGAELKTAGMALRKADWLFKGTSIDPREVQLLFVPAGRPYRFTHRLDGRLVASSAVPRYRFIWQVDGVIDTLSDRSPTTVALLDYDTGRVIYDVRNDLPPSKLKPEPTTSPLPEPSPSITP